MTWRSEINTFEFKSPSHWPFTCALRWTKWAVVPFCWVKTLLCSWNSSIQCAGDSSILWFPSAVQAFRARTQKLSNGEMITSLSKQGILMYTVHCAVTTKSWRHIWLVLLVFQNGCQGVRAVPTLKCISFFGNAVRIGRFSRVSWQWLLGFFPGGGWKNYILQYCHF